MLKLIDLIDDNDRMYVEEGAKINWSDILKNLLDICIHVKNK